VWVAMSQGGCQSRRAASGPIAGREWRFMSTPWRSRLVNAAPAGADEQHHQRSGDT
jgi:hypothetical protein